MLPEMGAHSRSREQTAMTEQVSPLATFYGHLLTFALMVWMARPTKITAPRPRNSALTQTLRYLIPLFGPITRSSRRMLRRRAALNAQTAILRHLERETKTLQRNNPILKRLPPALICLIRHIQ